MMIVLGLFQTADVLIDTMVALCLLFVAAAVRLACAKRTCEFAVGVELRGAESVACGRLGSRVLLALRVVPNGCHLD